jgi:glucans biosynthesis protein C
MKNATPSLPVRNTAVDTLRTTVIVLVVLLHASLAYASFANYNPFAYAHSVVPVADPERWPAVDLPISFIDAFGMPLLFLLSGLFVYPALERRGGGGFFVSRLKRLGIPFVIAAFFISPIAFWPSYLLSKTYDATPYWIRFFTVDGWLIGAPWFLWVLLSFDGIVAAVRRWTPQWIALLRRPAAPWVLLLGSAAVFVPLSIAFSIYSWATEIGPFDVQPVRLPLYFGYFLAGVALGAKGPAAGWPRGWGAWLAGGLAAFGVNAVLFRAGNGPAFAAACLGISLGLLGLFQAWIHPQNRFIASLNANSFGIYLFHYPLVHWLQYLLIPAALPAPIKFAVVFAGALLLSWAASALIRRIPALRRSSSPAVADHARSGSPLRGEG